MHSMALTLDPNVPTSIQPALSKLNLGTDQLFAIGGKRSLLPSGLSLPRPGRQLHGSLGPTQPGS
jgi:hypothetical protein